MGGYGSGRKARPNYIYHQGTKMNHITNLTRSEVERIKLALSQLIDERDLDAAISLLECPHVASQA